MTKVLLAEDDLAVLEMYKLKFEEEGFTVLSASNGEEAVVKAKQEKPDIIFLDVLMPQKEGHQVLLELKEYEATKNIPVVFLTNLGDRIEDVRAAQELGAEDLIVKAHVTPTEVVAKAKEFLGRQRSG